MKPSQDEPLTEIAKKPLADLWERTHFECQQAAFGATSPHPHNSLEIRNYAEAHQRLARIWRDLAHQPATPQWAKHAALIAATDAERRAAAAYTQLRAIERQEFLERIDGQHS